MSDDRVVLQETVKEAQTLHSLEKEHVLQSIELVGKLRRLNAATTMGMSLGGFAKYIGLTKDQLLKRSQAASLFARYPKAKALFIEGRYDLTHLSLIAPKITDANSDIIFARTPGMAKRELEAFLSRLSKSGELSKEEGTISFSLTLTESQMRILDRAREVLLHGGKVPRTADILLMALEDLLERRDPVRKAARAVKRQETKSAEGRDTSDGMHRAPQSDKTPEQILSSVNNEATKAAPGHRPRIQNAIRHAVWIRDNARCTWTFPDGSRCPETMMLELDHIKMVCRGGQDIVDNLRLRCRHHNTYAAEQALGREPGSLHYAAGPSLDSTA